MNKSLIFFIIMVISIDTAYSQNEDISGVEVQKQQVFDNNCKEVATASSFEKKDTSSLADFAGGVPNTDAQNVLNFRKFCEGHLQRGMNISCHLLQYSPFGETSPKPFINSLLPNITNSINKFSNDLEIDISCGKTEIIQGESIDILVKLKNNTNKIIRTGSPKHYLNHLNKDSLITNHYGHAVIDISPFSTYYFFINPIGYISYSAKDYIYDPWHLGSYEYNISQFVGQNEFTSNKIDITINPIPDSLQLPFNELKFDPNNLKTTDDWENLLEKYKGTFYERQFYYMLLNTPKYREDIDLSARLYKEFILKYPDNDFSYSIINTLVYNYTYNKILIEDILMSLKTNKPDCKLLEVLRNQPEYMDIIKINYLLD